MQPASASAAALPPSDTMHTYICRDKYVEACIHCAAQAGGAVVLRTDEYRDCVSCCHRTLLWTKADRAKLDVSMPGCFGSAFHAVSRTQRQSLKGIDIQAKV